ncbi:MAG: hypothetical protein M3546_15355 [Actinomycetota bacterium]|nr:hypothetical protein [Actinomycetota bacterium]
MALVAGVVAHGGLAGALVESLVVLTVAAVLVAVWVRERRSGRDRAHGAPAELRDEE